MPALALGQEKGVLVRWLKAEGESVSKGEPLMEVETDKAIVTVEAPAAGILTRVSAAPGDEIPIGRTMALIVAAIEIEKEEVAADRAEADFGVAGSERASTFGSDPVAAREWLPGKRSERILASPKAKRLARERGIDLARLKGSGPGGAIVAHDITDRGEGDPDPDDSVVLPIEDSIDLHAFRPQDIPRVVEEYLTECVKAGLLEVRLVHGKGKGIQRRVVRSILEKHPAVEFFEDASMETGGWGATLVKLKRM
jgi:hypothetical protein